MTTEERERRMAMLRAAQPYTSGQQRYALDLLLQANSLINTARGGMAGDLEACETAAQPEEMLLHMQEYCTPRESDLVQMILNFIKASHLFQNYREFMAAQSPSDAPGDLQAAGLGMPSANPLQMLLQLLGGFGGSMGNSGGNNYLMEFLISQLSPEQQQLFEQLKSFTQTSGEEKEADYGTMASE